MFTILHKSHVAFNAVNFDRYICKPSRHLFTYILNIKYDEKVDKNTLQNILFMCLNYDSSPFEKKRFLNTWVIWINIYEYSLKLRESIQTRAPECCQSPRPDDPHFTYSKPLCKTTTNEIPSIADFLRLYTKCAFISRLHIV